jgi:trimethylamine--corrinoid protein Co-methyltransferase
MSHLGGPIERAMINAAVSQMAQYFEIPLYSTAGTSDAKKVDIQAAYESAMSSLLVAMSGANYIHDIAGLMEEDLTVSYEKLVMDNEILGMCQRVLKGIEVNDETLAVDLMIEKGPGDDYLAEEHTVRHMRDEFFMPQLANRQKRGELNGESDALARAGAFVRSIRESRGTGCLTAGVRREILETFPEIVRFPSTPEHAQNRILETGIKESNRWPRESKNLHERGGQARMLRD